VSTDKQELRKGCWKAIRAAGAARFPGVEGRIPNFVGAEAAAERLCQTDAFQRAKVIKCNPDSPQRPFRYAALKAGKIILMAVPKLKSAACFIELDPGRIDNLWKASSAKGAAELGSPKRPEELPPVDMIVTGCVGVGTAGRRLGKGGGYADLEYGILLETGKINHDITVATTVHNCQVLMSEMVPRSKWDLSIDIIATPTKLICPEPLVRGEGIYWDSLSEEKIAAIPFLATRR